MNNNQDTQQISRYRNEGLLVQELADKSIVDDIVEEVRSHFFEPIEHYEAMSRDDFHNYVLICQNKINQLNIQKRFYASEHDLIDKLAPDDVVLHESVVFLRAVRPKRGKNKEENPDFHRESFYSDDAHTPYVINMWMPVLNVTDDNTLCYVPESHLIPDDEIITEVDESWPGRVEKYSSGHKMGFFWMPKRIISGVDLSRATKIHFDSYSYSLFSSMLVHGGGVNCTDKIRFAVGFGMLPKSAVTSEIKNFFAADGAKHFAEL